MESLWKYLLLTEIAQGAAREVTARLKRIGSLPSESEETLLNIVNSPGAAAEGDFSIRLERAVGAVLAIPPGRSLESERVAISEALHRGPLAELRRVLGGLLSDRQRVAVLVDNLDKAWDRRADLRVLSDFLLGLLSAAQRLAADFRKSDAWRQSVNVSLAVFLRSDIFSGIRSAAREPDKISHSRLLWDDRESLFRILEERFQFNRGEDPAGSVWDACFVPRVAGIPTREYVGNRILPRPRDLIYLVNASIATAVNRGHSTVQQTDIEAAEKEYSRFAAEAFLVENVGVDVDFESVIYEFAGCETILSHSEVCTVLHEAGVPSEKADEVLEHLIEYSFLGIEVEDSSFEYAVDADDLRRTLVRARKFVDRVGCPRRFCLHPAFRPFLEAVERT